MLLILSVVFNFRLSSPSFDHEDSDSERESFRKTRGEKFEPGQALANEAKILKIHEHFEFCDVWRVKNALGSCAARNV